MNALRFAWWGLRDAAGRSIYLAATLAVAVAAWLTLTSLAAPFLPATASGDLDRISVSSAVEGQGMPLRFFDQIAQLDGVDQVAYASDGLAVDCKQGVMPPSIQAFGGEPEALLRIDDLWPPASAELAALQARWFDDPMGVLVGARTARDCGWAAGMAVAPRNIFTGEPVELHITGVLPEQKNPIANVVSFAHHAYFARRGEAVGEAARLSEIIVFPAIQKDLLAARIEEALASEFPPIEVRTGSHIDAALARYGQLQYVLGFVIAAVVLCAALVSISSLAYLAAQRRPQWAMLLTLGFGKAALFAGFVVENLIATLLALALGIAAGLLVLQGLPELVMLLFGGLAVPTWAWWQLPLWLGAILVLALVLPARIMALLQPVDTRAL